MAIDLRRVAAAAADAAFAEEGPNPVQQAASTAGRRRGGHGAMRGLAAGAVLVGAARLAAKRMPDITEHLPGLSELSDRLRDRVDDWLEEDRYDREPDDAGEEPDDYGDIDDEADEDIDDEDDEAIDDEADEDDDFDDEADDDIDADADRDGEDAEDEPDDEDVDDPEGEADDFEDEDEDYDEEDAPREDPVARPPKPPKRRKTAA